MDIEEHMEKKVDSHDSVDQLKRPFVEPKLEFVEPELIKQGKMEHLTGFFGTFSP